MNVDIQDQIKAETTRLVRSFCSQLLDASNGSQETFERYVSIFANQTVKEIASFVTLEKAEWAFDPFSRKFRI